MRTSPSSLLLAIDSSTKAAGLALYDGFQVLYEAVWLSPNHHTVELAPAVTNAMNKSGVNLSELGAVAVALGPGSFTGLRIGLALAKGLTMAQHIPLIGIPTLDVLSAAQPIRDLPLVAVLQAGRDRLAVGWYQAINGCWKPTGNIQVCTLQELSDSIRTPTLVCGELKEKERAFMATTPGDVLLASPAQSSRRPAFLAELAWNRWQAGEVDDPATLAPIYLHYKDPIPG
jgi:tRNA threonylcarbamoyladenosine biosynthesis protein TsaB